MNPEIEDPSHGLESAPYVEAVRKTMGERVLGSYKNFLRRTRRFLLVARFRKRIKTSFSTQ